MNDKEYLQIKKRLEERGIYSLRDFWPEHLVKEEYIPLMEARRKEKRLIHENTKSKET